MENAGENYSKRRASVLKSSYNSNAIDSATKRKGKCCAVLRFNLMVRCPQKCKKRCIKQNRRDIIQATKFRQLEKELHISYILKYLRVLKMLARENMSTKEWKRKYFKYSILQVSESEEDDDF